MLYPDSRRQDFLPSERQDDRWTFQVDSLYSKLNSNLSRKNTVDIFIIPFIDVLRVLLLQE